MERAPTGAVPPAQAKEPKAPNAPNKIALEYLAIKKAAHEVSTGDGIVKTGSLRTKTAECYPRQLRLICHPDHGEFEWPDVPWAAKGKGVLFTLEDSCVKRPLVDLWKEAGKIDAEIRKTFMVYWKDWLNDDGEIPSGKTLEDGANHVLEQYWKACEAARLQKLKEKKEKEAAMAPAAAEGQPPTVVAQAVDATAADFQIVQATTAATTRSPLREIGAAALSALTSLAAASGIIHNDAEDEEEEDIDDSIIERTMPPDYNGGRLYLTWKKLGPCGLKLPCYQQAGAYDGAKPMSRADQKKRKLALSLEGGAKPGKGDGTLSGTLSGPVGEGKIGTKLGPVAQVYQSETAAKVATAKNYAVDLELQRLKMLVEHAPTPELKQKHSLELYEYAANQTALMPGEAVTSSPNANLLLLPAPTQ
jgi:hypothetical protein